MQHGMQQVKQQGSPTGRLVVRGLKLALPVIMLALPYASFAQSTAGLPAFNTSRKIIPHSQQFESRRDLSLVP